MSESVDPLVRDLLTWLGEEGRLYTDVMEGWRTACPRLPIWEDATDRGLVSRRRVDGTDMVVVSSAGRRFLAEEVGAVFCAREEREKSPAPNGVTA